MRTTYRFIPPYTKSSFKKRFSSDEAALQYASSMEDSAATVGVGKPMEGFWSQTFECFMPVECMTAAAKKIMEVEAENERLKRFLHRDNLTEA
jgi:hypothetical protein